MSLLKQKDLKAFMKHTMCFSFKLWGICFTLINLILYNCLENIQYCLIESVECCIPESSFQE